MTVITTITSGPLTGSGNIPATLLDPTCNTVTVNWDITNHLVGNSISMHVSVDVSQDNGVTWINLGGSGRTQGMDLLMGNPDPFSANYRHSVPGVGNPQRMIRAFLLTSAAIATSMSLVEEAV